MIANTAFMALITVFLLVGWLAGELAWGRTPDSVESEKAVSYVEQCKRLLRQSGASEESIELKAWSSYARIVLTANEFIYVN